MHSLKLTIPAESTPNKTSKAVPCDRPSLLEDLTGSKLLTVGSVEIQSNREGNF